MSIKKQLQLFVTREDEIEFTHLLKAEREGIVFLNGNTWQAAPECRDGIHECERGIVYLYDRPLDQLPTGFRKDGRLEGPVAGCVIQILRPHWEDGVMLSGSVAVGYREGDMHMKDIVSTVWKCVKHLGKTGVARPDGRVDKNYLVGDDARKRIAAGEFSIADRAIRMPYVPAG